MIRFIRKFRTPVTAVLFLGLLVAGTLSNGSVALAANWSNRDQFQGYFNKSDTATSVSSECTRGPVLYNNCYADAPAIPYGVTTGDQVLTFLQNRYNNPKGNGGKWDKTGVSFIVNTMLGNDPDNAVRNITAAMWTDLQQRLEQNGLTIDVQPDVGPGDYGNYDTFYQHDDDDVAYYNVSSGDDGKAMVFKVNGKTEYVLLYDCGNPIGNFSGIDKPPQWTIVPTTTATKTNTTTTPPLAANEVIPGDTVTWTGTVKNNGPDATDAPVTVQFNKSNGWTGTTGVRTVAKGFAKNATSSATFVYKATNADLNKTLCVSTQAQPHAWNDTSAIESSTVCYKVVYRYELHPSVTVGATSVETGSSTAINVNYSVNNGGPTISQSTGWQLTQCKFNGLPTNGSGETNNAQAGQVYYAAGGSCTNVQTGTSVFNANTTTNLGTITANTAGLTAGTRLCYGLTVNPPSATTTGYRHSPLVCIAILKYPKLQALGGDVRANNVQTHTSANIGGKFYGSWSEYALFGIGSITGMSSAASLAGGAVTNAPASQTHLTFANTPSGGNFYSTPPALDAYYNAYYDSTKAVSGATAGGAVPNGTVKVVSVNGNLTISSDITYSGSYPTAADVPHVIYVVSGNIIVNEGVQRVDAWLIAKGTLYTCNKYMSRATKITTNDCKNQLTFNGPVNVGDTLLGRTFGADAGAGDPGAAAEVFNLAPSNYLSTYTAAQSNSNIETVYEKELPPRW